MQNRDFVTPEDVDDIFVDVCRHRIILFPKAKMANVSEEDILKNIVSKNVANKL